MDTQPLRIVQPAGSSLQRWSASSNRDASARQHRWHSAAKVTIWSLNILVVVIWLMGGEPQALGQGTASAITAIARIVGLVASNLLLLQMIFMSRVPIFERGLGRDRITRLHRACGFWSFWLILLHIVLITVGYAMSDQQGLIAELWNLIWTFPGMLLATVGTLLIIGVVATSIRWARRRTRYESWHLLHLYAYLGVWLALPHQLWTGADFLSSPIATAYWWGMWALSAGCMLTFRIILPTIKSRFQWMTVQQADMTRGSVHLVVRGKQLDRFHAVAGQFFIWRFLNGPGWTRGHPFSLAAAPTASRFTIAARVVGDGTRNLLSIKPGTRVLVEGPYGDFTGAQRTQQKLLMMGAGAGVTPLVSLLEEQRYLPGDAVLVTRDASGERALLQAQIVDLVDTRGVRHVPLNGRRTTSSSSWLPKSHEQWTGVALIAAIMPDIEHCDVYLCGPAPWMRGVTTDLKTMGVNAARIHFELFAV